MQLFIEPVDVWLFRDGRPFDAGSDHRAQSLFPPYPSVIQGVLRSHHLAMKNVDLRDRDAIAAAVGSATDLKGLRLRGPFVAKRENGAIVRYLPTPTNATRRGDQIIGLTPRERPQDVRSSSPTSWLLWPTGEPERGETGAWLSERDLLAYFQGKPVKAIFTKDLFERENRFGIGLDSIRRTTREGALYEVEFIRPQPGIGLFVEVGGLDGWPEHGTLRIGGEGRGGYFEQVSGLSWPAAPDPLPERFQIYFATPTCFRKGWLPEDWGQFFEGQVKLLAAAVGRYQSVGGFDWANDDHKPAQRYVLAGSVYFFQGQGQVRLRPGLVQQAITDFGAEIGFGQIIIEEWKNVRGN